MGEYRRGAERYAVPAWPNLGRSELASSRHYRIQFPESLQRIWRPGPLGVAICGIAIPRPLLRQIPGFRPPWSFWSFGEAQSSLRGASGRVFLLLVETVARLERSGRVKTAEPP